MKIRDLLEADEDGRLETRMADDPDQGTMAVDPTDASAEEEDSFQDGMEAGAEEGRPDFDSVDEPDEPIVDDRVWSQVSNAEYVTNYEHSGNETIHPRVIASMDKSDLARLQDKVDDMISRHEMDKGGVGLYKDTTYNYLSSLQSFIRSVIEEKS